MDSPAQAGDPRKVESMMGNRECLSFALVMFALGVFVGGAACWLYVDHHRAELRQRWEAEQVKP